MKLVFATAIMAGLMTGTASAETLGISMQSFDNSFQILLREGLQARAAETKDTNVQFKDAQTDISKQFNQINNFIAARVDGIILTLAHASAAPGTKAR